MLLRFYLAQQPSSYGSYCVADAEVQGAAPVVAKATQERDKAAETNGGKYSVDGLEEQQNPPDDAENVVCTPSTCGTCYWGSQ